MTSSSGFDDLIAAIAMTNEIEDEGAHTPGTIANDVADVGLRQPQGGGSSYSYTAPTVARGANNGMMPSSLCNPISVGRSTPSISVTTTTTATNSDISALTDETAHHPVEPQFLPTDKGGIDDAHALRLYRAHAHHFSKEFPILTDKDAQPNPAVLGKWKNLLKDIWDFTRNSVTESFLEYMQQLARTYNFLDRNHMPGKSVKDIQCLVLQSDDGECTKAYLERVLRFLKIPMCQDLSWVRKAQDKVSKRYGISFPHRKDPSFVQSIALKLYTGVNQRLKRKMEQAVGAVWFERLPKKIKDMKEYKKRPVKIEAMVINIECYSVQGTLVKFIQQQPIQEKPKFLDNDLETYLDFHKKEWLAKYGGKSEENRDESAGEKEEVHHQAYVEEENRDESMVEEVEEVEDASCTEFEPQDDDEYALAHSQVSGNPEEEDPSGEKVSHPAGSAEREDSPQEIDQNPSQDIVPLPAWGTNVTNLGSGPWDAINPGESSKCGRFVVAMKGMILPPWGTDIRQMNEGPWVGMAREQGHLSAGAESSCGNFFLSGCARIFRDYDEMNKTISKVKYAAHREGTLRALQAMPTTIAQTKKSHTATQQGGGNATLVCA